MAIDVLAYVSCVSCPWAVELANDFTDCRIGGWTRVRPSSVQMLSLLAVSGVTASVIYHREIHLPGKYERIWVQFAILIDTIYHFTRTHTDRQCFILFIFIVDAAANMIIIVHLICLSYTTPLISIFLPRLWPSAISHHHHHNYVLNWIQWTKLKIMRNLHVFNAAARRFH